MKSNKMNFVMALVAASIAAVIITLVYAAQGTLLLVDNAGVYFTATLFAWGTRACDAIYIAETIQYLWNVLIVFTAVLTITWLTLHINKIGGFKPLFSRDGKDSLSGVIFSVFINTFFAALWSISHFGNSPIIILIIPMAIMVIVCACTALATKKQENRFFSAGFTLGTIVVITFVIASWTIFGLDMGKHLMLPLAGWNLAALIIGVSIGSTVRILSRAMKAAGLPIK